MSQTVVEIKALKDRDSAAAIDSLGTTIAGMQAGTSNTTQLKLAGATSGTITVKAAAVAGTNTLTLPAGTTDLSATGGASQVLKQTSVGGAITVGTVAQSDLTGNLTVISTSTLTKNADTTFALVPGLTVSLAAGATYVLSGHLTITASNAAAGIKVCLATPDTLTLTSGTFSGMNFNGVTTNANSTATALGAAFGNATAAVTDVYIEGSLVVNAAGTLQVQAAQNASNGSNMTVGTGSFLTLTKVS